MGKRYIGVDADKIRIILHSFDDTGFNNNRKFPQPLITSFTKGIGTEIFERNGIPEKYQKMFMVVENNLSMTFQNLRGHHINLSPATFRFNRFKASEYISGASIFLAYNSRHELKGQQAGYPDSFDLDRCYVSNKEDVDYFMLELRDKGLFDNYIKSIMEITYGMYISAYDSNKEDKIIQPQYIKK